MRITSLEIDGFGIWNGLKLDTQSDGLTVIYGPNEAGKTTLMQFVRTVLYGFTSERRRYLPPVHGGQPGGSLHVIGDSGSFQISRHLESGKSATEEVVLWAADGTRQGEHLLRSLLSNLDEIIFQNVFAVGLRELQELATLSDTDAAALLYNISAGLDRVALVDVIRELDQSRNRLLDADGGPSQITQLLAEREKLQGEQEHSQAALRRYERLAAERDQLEREAAQLDEENRQFQHELRVAEIAMAVRGRWHERAALDAQLAGLASGGSMPEDSLERLEAINARLERRQQRVDRLREQYDKLREERSELKTNDALGRLAPRIEALHDQGQWLDSLENRLLELEVETTDLEQQRKAQYEKCGLGKDTRPEALPTIPKRSLHALRQPASAVRRCRQRLQEARGEVERGQTTEQSLLTQIESALVERGESDLNGAVERTSALVGLLRRRVQLDERLEQMDLHQAELEQKSHGLMDKQLLPAWRLIALGCLFVAGPSLVLFWAIGLMIAPSLSVPMSGWYAVAGLVATACSVMWKFLLERMNARELDSCHQQIRMLQAQVKQTKEERESLDRQLPRGGGSVLVRLQTAERELASLEEIVPLDSRRQAAQQDTRAATDRVREAENELTGARRRWRDALRTLGLPKDLAPKQVRQLAAGAERVRDIQQRLERLHEETQQRKREMDGLCSRIQQIVAEAGLTLERQSPQEQLKALAEQLRQHEVARKRLGAIRGRVKQLRRKRSRHEGVVRKLKSQRRRLLREVGVEDENEFRQRAAQIQQVAALRRDWAALAREIEAAIGNHCPEEEIGKVLQRDSQDRLQSRCEQLQRRLADRQSEVRTRFEKRGQVAEQLRLMAEDRQPAARRLQQAIVQRRLEEAIERWRSLAVTCRILQTVRTIYERDRQPETLKEASGYLNRMTEGRYLRVWTPLGEEVLRVDDHEGRSLAVEVLSQGAREQLFLCLRLALANSYGRRGIEMPVILDDVLVNFDSHRAKAAAAVLRDFAASGHQVIVFTCHEHIMKLFQALKVTVSQLPDREASHSSERAALPAPVERRRKPRRAPVVEPDPPEEEPEPPAEEVHQPQIEELAPWEEADGESDQEPDAFQEDEGDEDEFPEEDESDSYDDAFLEAEEDEVEAASEEHEEEEEEDDYFEDAEEDDEEFDEDDAEAA